MKLHDALAGLSAAVPLSERFPPNQDPELPPEQTRCKGQTPAAQTCLWRVLQTPVLLSLLFITFGYILHS